MTEKKESTKPTSSVDEANDGFVKSEIERGNEMSEAVRVDALADWAPTTEQSARENAGNVRGANDGNPSRVGVTDTPNAVPGGAVGPHAVHDFTHRGESKLQGEGVESTGDQKERRNTETHL